MDFKTKALLRGAPIIGLAIALLFSVAYGVSALANLPFSLGLPLWLRGIGAALVVVGLGIMAWVFRLRGAGSLIVSTYITLMKFATRTPLEAKAGRDEPLVIVGPYKFVRSPLYFGVVVMVLGWGLLTAYSFVLLATVVIFVWFRVILTPYEEKELRALFGAQFDEYAKEVPMVVPFTKFGRKPKVTT